MSVAGGVDVNGDGFDDVILGDRGVFFASSHDAPIATPVGYVVYGRATGLGAAVDLSGLGGADGFTFFRDPAVFSAPIAAGGYSVAGIGDFNGDGFADVAFGAFAYSELPAAQGSTYVVFGSLAGTASHLTPTISTVPTASSWPICRQWARLWRAAFRSPVSATTTATVSTICSSASL